MAALVDAGRRDEARTHFEHLASRGFGSLPRDRSFLACAAALTIVAIALEDRERAAELEAILSPYASFNTPDVLASSLGSVAHYLGLVAQYLGRPEVARERFEFAMVRNREMACGRASRGPSWHSRRSSPWRRGHARERPRSSGLRRRPRWSSAFATWPARRGRSSERSDAHSEIALTGLMTRGAACATRRGCKSGESCRLGPGPIAPSSLLSPPVLLEHPGSIEPATQDDGGTKAPNALVCQDDRPAIAFTAAAGGSTPATAPPRARPPWRAGR